MHRATTVAVPPVFALKLKAFFSLSRAKRVACYSLSQARLQSETELIPPLCNLTA